MQNKAKEITYFFYSQAFADGIRATVGVLLPALLGSYTGYLEEGMTISLGAMCISLTDAPGPIRLKLKGMSYAIFFAFLTAIITSLARTSIYTLAVEIALVSFFFSMFSVYGNRAASVGSAALLVMILTMDNVLSKGGIIFNSVLVLSGGIFYMILSLLLHSLRPYRIAQRTLGECIREMAAFLSIKADFYDTTTDLEQNYRKMIGQQVLVNEKQEAVREVLFKTRQIVRESTVEGRKLVFTFVETVDLFENITAAYYDYALIRKKYAGSESLEIISQFLKRMANEMDLIGIAIQTHTGFHKSFDYDEALRQLKLHIDTSHQKNSSERLVLTKIIVNIRKVLKGMLGLTRYFEKDIEAYQSRVDHSRFVSHQSLDPQILFDNLTLQSSVFRHAIRVSLACVAGYIVARFIGYGQYSYWILLTVAFILKPAFSLTKQRNIQRVIGTLAGGAIAVLILVFIPDKTIQFVFMVLFMIGTYSFLRINYLMMVIFTTPYVVILFSFFGEGFKDVAEERILDTIIGSVIAFMASYLLFPRWESEELGSHMKGMIKANLNYLQKILDALGGKKPSMLDYKLARKNVYLNLANLSAAFQRMLSEPKNKQAKAKDVHQFVVLNHILFSNIATVATTLISREERSYPKQLYVLAKKARNQLKRESEDKVLEQNLPSSPEVILEADDALMKEQLEFIYKVAADISKSEKVIAAK